MSVEIQMRELVNFCDTYNAIGYGVAQIIELDSKFIVKLYNGGFSENEELDAEFRTKYASFIILDYHPILIAEFHKVNLFSHYVVGFDNLKDWCSCYSKQPGFSFLLEVE